MRQTAMGLALEGSPAASEASADVPSFVALLTALADECGRADRGGRGQVRSRSNKPRAMC
jgi:hypothetical protein